MSSDDYFNRLAQQAYQRREHKPSRGDACFVSKPYRSISGLVIGACSAGVLVEFPGVKDCDWVEPHCVKVLFCENCGMPRADRAGDKCLYGPTSFEPEKTDGSC